MLRYGEEGQDPGAEVGAGGAAKPSGGMLMQSPGRQGMRPSVGGRRLSRLPMELLDAGGGMYSSLLRGRREEDNVLAGDLLTPALSRENVLRAVLGDRFTEGLMEQGLPRTNGFVPPEDPRRRASTALRGRLPTEVARAGGVRAQMLQGIADGARDVALGMSGMEAGVRACRVHEPLSGQYLSEQDAKRGGTSGRGSQLLRRARSMGSQAAASRSVIPGDTAGAWPLEREEAISLDDLAGDLDRSGGEPVGVAPAPSLHEETSRVRRILEGIFSDDPSEVQDELSATGGPSVRGVPGAGRSFASLRTAS